MKVIVGYIPIYKEVPELDVFEAHKQRLMEESPGKYVYIVGDQIIGPFETSWDAAWSKDEDHGGDGLIISIGFPPSPIERRFTEKQKASLGGHDGLCSERKGFDRGAGRTEE